MGIAQRPQIMTYFLVTPQLSDPILLRSSVATAGTRPRWCECLSHSPSDVNDDVAREYLTNSV